MLELIDNLPKSSMGVCAKGKVTKEDYETVLIPTLEKKLATSDKINFLYVLDDEFDGFEFGAMLDDAKVGFKHYFGFKKIGVVTNKSWARGLTKLIGVLMPADVKLYQNDELPQAKEWLIS